MKIRLSILLFLLASISVYAYSGMGDSMMDQMINMVAICAVILIVQLVMWFFLKRWFQISNFSQKLYNRGVKVCSNKYRAIFTFWALFAFASAPYLGVVSVFTMSVIWLVLLIAVFSVLFVKKRRETWLSPRNYSILVKLSLTQVIGMVVYALVCRLPIFTKIFYYDWGEVPELEFYSYANLEAYVYLIIMMVYAASYMLVPIVVYSLCDLVSHMKRQIKTD